MICLRNICINTLHKGDDDGGGDDDDDDNNNNNNNIHHEISAISRLKSNAFHRFTECIQSGGQQIHHLP